LIKRLATIAAIAAMAALCGCGGSGNDGSAATAQSTTSGSKAGDSNAPWNRPKASKSSPRYKAFIEQADAICNRGKLRAYQATMAYLARHKSSHKPKSQRFLEAIQTAYLPSIERQIKEIRAVEPPPGEGWQVTAFVVALQEGIYSENRSSINPQFGQSFKHSAELARTLGIKACVYSGLG
jgi:hypothetical protein